MKASQRILWSLAIAGGSLALAQQVLGQQQEAGVSADEGTRLSAATAAAWGDVDHKELWPLDGRDITTIFLAALGLIVAAGGGIGGGGILVPLFIIVLQFSPKHAIPLSNVTILGGAIANTLFSVLSRHPRADRPLLDWNIILVMEPVTIIGAVFGSFVNKLLPGLVISVLLVVVLALLARRTLSKGIKQLQKEGGFSSAERVDGPLLSVNGEQRASYGANNNGSEGASSSSSSRRSKSGYDSTNGVPAEIVSTRLPHSPVTRMLRKLSSSSYGEAIGESKKEPQQGADEEKQQLAVGSEGEAGMGSAAADIARRERKTPLWKPALLTLCFLGVATLDVLKGGEGKSILGFSCGSWLYWVTTLAVLPWVATFFIIIRAHVLDDYKAKVEAGYEFQPDDIKWTSSSTIRYPLLCCTAGLFAGIFGVGGGIVKGPLMLEMGVAPPVAAASAACMILYTSAAASVAFYVFGLIPIDYGIFFFFWGFLCTATGQTLVHHAMTKYKKESFVVLSIGAVIFLSAILMAYESLRNFIQHPEAALRASPLCG